jgi:DNA-binding beta-propeller fold protein YncE
MRSTLSLRSLTPLLAATLLTWAVAQPAHAEVTFVGAYGLTPFQQFSRPSSVSQDAQGHIWVADPGLGNILEFSPEGKVLNTWGTHGNIKTYLPGAIALTVAPNGYLYVLRGNGTIYKCDLHGNIKATYSIFPRVLTPLDLTADADSNLYVIGQTKDAVYRYNSNGEFVAEWLLTGTTETVTPIAINAHIVGRTTYLYVSDSRSRILKYSTNGVLLKTYGHFGAGRGELDYAKGVAVDPNGLVYVCDYHNDRVEIFEPNGDFAHLIIGPTANPPLDKTAPLDIIYYHQTNSIYVLYLYGPLVRYSLF